MIEAVLREQGVAKVVVRLGTTGLKPQDLAVAGDRFVEPAQNLEGHAQVVMVLPVRRVEANGAAQQVDGLAVTPCLMKDNAEQIERRGVGRLALDQRTAGGFCLVKAAGTEMLQGLGESCHASWR